MEKEFSKYSPINKEEAYAYQIEELSQQLFSFARLGDMSGYTQTLERIKTTIDSYLPIAQTK